MFWTFLIASLLIIWLFKLNKDWYVLAFFAKRVKTSNGSPLESIAPVVEGKTIFGNTFDFWKLDNETIFEINREYARKYGKSFIQYSLGYTFYNVTTPEDAECVLNDQNLITKGIVYNFLQPFLRTGLLTSTDKKWHSRRKMLTPAFHFNILNQFEEIFKQESKKFVKSLQDAKEEDTISLSKVIPKFTLNTVCETALGVQLDDRLDGNQYRKSFKMIEECFVRRVTNPFLFIEALYERFEGYKYLEHYDVVHDFSSSIIEKRRQLFAEELKTNSLKNTSTQDDSEFFGKKKRYAMLDTLLTAERDGLIDHIGICEEVDTFMFEGFDTTSMGLTFGLMNLSLHPEIQERCYQEIIENISDDLDKLDLTELNKLKYLECFIKETLRLYPSVPVIMRTAVRETQLANKLILPAGTHITVHIFDIHRDPRHFENPEKFDPERFTPENSEGRHPFAYVPFSAGPRNCIGQKFAMLEMKTLLVYILKKFKVLPVTEDEKMKFEIGIIIRSKKDIKVKFSPRS